MVRPVQYTVAPASPSATAVPRPAPRVAPATSATLPSSGLVIVENLTPVGIAAGSVLSPWTGLGSEPVGYG